MHTRNGEWHHDEGGERGGWQEEEGNENARKGFLGFLQGRSGVRLERVGPTVEWEGRWGRAALPRSCAQHFNRFHLRACE